MKKHLFILAAALLPQAALAQVDVTLQGGYRAGGFEASADIVCLAAVNGPCERYAKSDDGSIFGLTVGFPVGGDWAVEVHASRQVSDLSYSDPVGLIVAGKREATVTVLEGDLVRRFELGKWEPFAGAGIGVARLDSDPLPVLQLDDEDRITANLVGGVRYSFSESWGLRLEGRARYLSLPEELDGDELTIESSIGIGLRL